MDGEIVCAGEVVHDVFDGHNVLLAEAIDELADLCDGK